MQRLPNLLAPLGVARALAGSQFSTAMALGAVFALSGTVAPIAPAHGSQRHLGGLLACRLAPNGNGRGVVRFDSFNQSKTHGTGYATCNKRARYIPSISLLTSLFIAPAAGVKKPAQWLGLSKLDMRENAVFLVRVENPDVRKKEKS